MSERRYGAHEYTHRGVPQSFEGLTLEDLRNPLRCASKVERDLIAHLDELLTRTDGRPTRAVDERRRVFAMLILSDVRSGSVYGNAAGIMKTLADFESEVTAELRAKIESEVSRGDDLNKVRKDYEASFGRMAQTLGMEGTFMGAFGYLTIEERIAKVVGALAASAPSLADFERSPQAKKESDAIHDAWGVIANALDWEDSSRGEWREAAARWRDTYVHSPETLAKLRAEPSAAATTYPSPLLSNEEKENLIILVKAMTASIGVGPAEWKTQVREWLAKKTAETAAARKPGTAPAEYATCPCYEWTDSEKATLVPGSTVRVLNQVGGHFSRRVVKAADGHAVALMPYKDEASVTGYAWADPASVEPPADADVVAVRAAP